MELIVLAYQERAWEELGYSNWDACSARELGDLKLQLPKEGDRRKIMCTMCDRDLSLSGYRHGHRV